MPKLKKPPTENNSALYLADILFSPPALLPDDPKEAYKMGCEQTKRIYDKNDVYFLNLLRNEVQKRRKRLIQNGKVQPANEKEKGWLQ